MTANELIFNTNKTISYLKGVKLFDQRLTALKDGDSYTITFKILHEDLLIKLKNEDVSAKLLLTRELITLIEFTTYKKHIEFTIYYDHEQHKTIVFTVKKAAITQLKAFLESQSLDYVENEKVEHPQPMRANVSVSWIESVKGGFILLFIIGIVCLVCFLLYQIITSINFSSDTTKGVIRFLSYIGVIVALIIGAVSRFK
jgi:hypothetical protein